MKKLKKNSEKPKKKTKKFEERKEETKLEEEITKAEEEIEESREEFFEEPVRQLPISSQTSAPVLERIIENQTPAEIPVESSFSTEQREAREQPAVNYAPANEPQYGFRRTEREDKEKKYETNFVPPVLSRREFSQEGIRREFLKPSENVWNPSSEQQIDEIDFIEQEARLPFEEQQKKYKRTKLR